MPIELGFSKVKTALDNTQEVDMETAFLAVFAALIPEDCQSWIAGSIVNSPLN